MSLPGTLLLYLALLAGAGAAISAEIAIATLVYPAEISDLIEVLL